MGLWYVNADTLANGRFVVSPLAETTSALIALYRGDAAHPGERAWLAEHLAAYRRTLDPISARLIDVALGETWLADILTPTPTGVEALFEEEVAVIRATPPAVAEADLRAGAAHNGTVLPQELRGRADLATRMADVLTWVWTTAVLPYWPRSRRILEADIVARTRQLTRGGWAAALGDMRPNMRWLGDGRLQINARPYPPREISGAQLFFVPVTHGGHWVSWDTPHRYAVVYPCSGVLADVDRAPSRAPLGALLGAARANVLVAGRA